MDKDASEPDTLDLEWMEGDMPYSTAFGDQFYCREDGRAECDQVFLAGNGLPGRWQAGGPFTIGELGFGTGLNFCETWRVWKEVRIQPSHGVSGKDPLWPAGHLPHKGGEDSRLPRGSIEAPADQQVKSLPLVGRGWGGENPTLHFISFELYPMQRDSIFRALGRWPEIAAERQALTDAWPDQPHGVVDLALAPDVRLSVVCGAALANVGTSHETFDAWYLDGFAPSRNGDMWSEALMRAVFDHTRSGGTFATYAAAGFVRRNLVAAGFAVERRPGYGGKREMLCGRKA